MSNKLGYRRRDVMVDATPEEALAELEEDTSHFRYNRWNAYQKIAEEFENIGDEDGAKRARTEAAAHVLDTEGDYLPGYFQPRTPFAEGNAIRTHDIFDSERLNYLTDRAMTSSNPIHASRYADVVWDFSEKKNPEMARIAVDKYLESAKIYRRNGWEEEFGKVLIRAAVLSSLIRDSERLTEVKDSILRFLKELDSSQEYRYCLELATAIERSRLMKLTQNEWQEVLGILEKAAIYFQGVHPKRNGTFGPVEGPKENLVQAFRKARLKFAAHSDSLDIQEERLAIAESHERQGDIASEEGNSIAALTIYLKAEKQFADLGLRNDRDRLRVKLADAGHITEAEMRPVSAELNIEVSRIEEYIRPLLTESLKDSLKRIATAPHFIPSVGGAREQIEKLRKESPLEVAFPRIHLKKGHVAGVAIDNREILDASLTHELMMQIGVGTVFRTHLFNKLKEEYGLDPDSLVSHFQDWGLCRQRNLALIKRGFELYFGNDFISSLHILVLQFEDILRNMFESAGWPVSKPPHG
ncbi:MAG: hypothetical protein KAW09_12165, partial [Thermoplasmata archaeon]|nr:hypothetical protein [Thermoplasmata archaeon]